MSATNAICTGCNYVARCGNSFYCRAHDEPLQGATSWQLIPCKSCISEYLHNREVQERIRSIPWDAYEECDRLADACDLENI